MMLKPALLVTTDHQPRAEPLDPDGRLPARKGGPEAEGRVPDPRHGAGEGFRPLPASSPPSAKVIVEIGSSDGFRAQ